jgi:hypothetical protein
VVTELAKLINGRMIKPRDHLEARVEKENNEEGVPEETIVFYRTNSQESRTAILSPSPHHRRPSSLEDEDA